MALAILVLLALCPQGVLCGGTPDLRTVQASRLVGDVVAVIYNVEPSMHTVRLVNDIYSNKDVDYESAAGLQTVEVWDGGYRLCRIGYDRQNRSVTIAERSRVRTRPFGRQSIPGMVQKESRSSSPSAVELLTLDQSGRPRRRETSTYGGGLLIEYIDQYFDQSQQPVIRELHRYEYHGSTCLREVVEQDYRGLTRTQEFTFDSDGRLTKARYTDSDLTMESQYLYELDDRGNWVTLRIVQERTYPDTSTKLEVLLQVRRHIRYAT